MISYIFTLGTQVYILLCVSYFTFIIDTYTSVIRYRICHGNERVPRLRLCRSFQRSKNKAGRLSVLRLISTFFQPMILSIHLLYCINTNVGAGHNRHATGRQQTRRSQRGDRQIARLTREADANTGSTRHTIANHCRAGA